MTGFASVKQVEERHRTKLTESLRPLAVFAGGAVAQAGGAARPDPAGRLLLASGNYLVMLTAEVQWKYAPNVTWRAGCGGDPGFRGGRPARGPPPGVGPRRHVAAWGLVSVPPGSEPVACEVYGRAGGGYGTEATVSAAELIAVTLPGGGA